MLYTSSGVKLLHFSLDAEVANANEEVLDYDMGNAGKFEGPCLKRIER